MKSIGGRKKGIQMPHSKGADRRNGGGLWPWYCGRKRGHSLGKPSEIKRGVFQTRNMTCDRGGGENARRFQVSKGFIA